MLEADPSRRSARPVRLDAGVRALHGQELRDDGDPRRLFGRSDLRHGGGWDRPGDGRAARRALVRGSRGGEIPLLGPVADVGGLEGRPFSNRLFRCLGGNRITAVWAVRGWIRRRASRAKRGARDAEAGRRPRRLLQGSEGVARGGNGDRHASGSHATKQAAVEQARKLARRAKSELVVHKQDGTIGERRTYGRDPFPPRGFAVVSAACLRSS
jgi:hypothetical protein